MSTVRLTKQLYIISKNDTPAMQNVCHSCLSQSLNGKKHINIFFHYEGTLIRREIRKIRKTMHVTSLPFGYKEHNGDFGLVINAPYCLGKAFELQHQHKHCFLTLCPHSSTV